MLGRWLGTPCSIMTAPLPLPGHSSVCAVQFKRCTAPHAHTSSSIIITIINQHAQLQQHTHLQPSHTARLPLRRAPPRSLRQLLYLCAQPPPSHPAPTNTNNSSIPRKMPPPPLPVTPEEVRRLASSAGRGGGQTLCAFALAPANHHATCVRCLHHPPPWLAVQLEFFAEEELIQIVPNCSVPGGYIDGVLVRGCAAWHVC